MSEPRRSVHEKVTPSGVVCDGMPTFTFDEMKKLEARLAAGGALYRSELLALFATAIYPMSDTTEQNEDNEGGSEGGS